jgi:hypothetical protein
MPHSHWPASFPEARKLRICGLSKKECDLIWTQYQHGHEGRECKKQVLPGNVTATCVLTMTPEQLDERLSRRVRDGYEGPDTELPTGLRRFRAEDVESLRSQMFSGFPPVVEEELPKGRGTSVDV